MQTQLKAIILSQWSAIVVSVNIVCHSELQLITKLSLLLTFLSILTCQNLRSYIENNNKNDLLFSNIVCILQLLSYFPQYSESFNVPHEIKTHLFYVNTIGFSAI